MFFLTANQWRDSDQVPCGNGTGIPGKISPLIEELLYISHSTDLAVRMTEVQYNLPTMPFDFGNIGAKFPMVCSRETLSAP